MLTEKQQNEFEDNGIVVLPRFLGSKTLKSLEQVSDELQGKASYSGKGRWDMRNCLPKHLIFSDLLIRKSLLTTVRQLLDCNAKLLGSHLVKVRGGSTNQGLILDWHRDGGVMSVS